MVDFFLKKMYSSLDIEKVKKYMVTAYIHALILESCSAVFNNFRVLLVACVIYISLENSFYIDVNKNVVSHFNNHRLLFLILLSMSCKKMKHNVFLIHFGKRLEGKLWLGVWLGSCDK